MFDQFTLGIEEEFQIVDPQTRELRSHVAEILDEALSKARGDDEIEPWQALERIAAEFLAG